MGSEQAVLLLRKQLKGASLLRSVCAAPLAVRRSHVAQRTAEWRRARSWRLTRRRGAQSLPGIP